MIFFSYSRRDIDFAMRLVADLQNMGVSLWVDKLNIVVGTEWSTQLQDALDCCEGLIFVVSPTSVESKYCKRELMRADNRDIPIFPILLTPLEKPANWPLELQGKQYIDFTKWEDLLEYRKGLKDLFSNISLHNSNFVKSLPSLETQYLNSLMGELEAKLGVLEYIEMNNEVEDDIRPKIQQDDEWGFSLLADFRITEGESKKLIILPNIAEAIKRYKRFVLVGKPGAGKTTSLRRLARDNCKQAIDDPNSPFPILIHLSQWSSNDTFEELIRNNWSLPSDPIKLLKNGDIVLYLDGLNEMGSNRNSKAQEINTWLKSENAPLNVVITCREEDYRDEELHISEVVVITIRDLNEEQVFAFVHNYLKDDTEEFLGLLQDSEIYHEDRSLNQLARNPYMLSALIQLYKNQRDIPTNVGTLFGKLTQSLWQREKLRNTAGWVTYDQMANTLGQLAYLVISNDMSLALPMSHVTMLLGKENRELFKAAHKANLVEIDGEYIRFYHQLLLEFFAAMHLIQIGIDGILETLALTWNSHNRIATKWDNVIIAFVGIVEDSDDNIAEIALSDPILALLCINSGVAINNATTVYVNNLIAHYGIEVSDYISTDSQYYTFQDILDNLGYQLHHGITAEDISYFGDLYYYIDDPHAIDSALQSLSSWPPTLREASAAVLEVIGNEIAIPGLIEALDDTDWFVAKAAASALIKLGGNHEWEIVRQFYARKNS